MIKKLLILLAFVSITLGLSVPESTTSEVTSDGPMGRFWHVPNNRGCLGYQSIGRMFCSGCNEYRVCIKLKVNH